MSRSKTPAPAVTNGPYTLRKSPGDVKDRLEESLIDGREILNLLESIRTREDFENFKSEFKSWDELNRDFLKAAFTDDRKSYEYFSHIGQYTIYGGSDLSVEIREEREELRSQLRKIETLIRGIRDFEISEEPRAAQVAAIYETGTVPPLIASKPFEDRESPGFERENVPFRIFVSHAGADEKYVKAFVRLLKAGFDISSKQIFCTSLPGHDIPAGNNWKTSIKENFSDSTLVFALVSENFNRSPFCLIEMGAVWITAKLLLPVLIPPFKPEDLPPIVKDLQAIRMD